MSTPPTRDADEFGAFVEGGRFQRAGRDDGPLAGMTFVAKDLFDVEGTVTGAGNPDWARTHGVAATTAPIVQQLLDAGADLVGKTHTDELSRGITGWNAHYGAPVNPAARERLTGGSSSGSAAAVAAGVADLGLGTDTGGSVRIPAAWCGLFGLRTTHGRVPLEGMVGQAPSFDTIGWMTRTAEAMARATFELLGGDAGFGTFRLLIAEDAWRLTEPGASAALEPALAQLRALAGAVETLALAPEGLLAWRDHQVVLQQREAWLEFDDWLEATQPRLTLGVAQNFLAGAAQDPTRNAEAAAFRASARDRVLNLLGDDGVLCIPTSPGPAALRAPGGREFDGRDLQAIWPAVSPLTCIAGLAGTPQVTLPVATLDGAPLGLSLLGAPGQDQSLVELGRRLATVMGL